MGGSDVATTHWLQKIWHWVKRRFRPKSSQSTKRPVILKRLSGEHCAVLSLRRQTRGAIATYRIVPKDSSDFYLLCWDDLRERDTERFDCNGTAVHLRSYQNPRWHTHGFSVWKIKASTGRPELIGAWNFNLEGKKSRLRKKNSLKSTASVVALEVAMALLTLPLTRKETWEQRVAQLDWLELVEMRSLVHLGENHDLRTEAQTLESDQ